MNAALIVLLGVFATAVVAVIARFTPWAIRKGIEDVVRRMNNGDTEDLHALRLLETKLNDLVATLQAEERGRHE